MGLSSCLALSLLLHVGSVHQQPGFNNVNPGLGISCAYTENVSISSGAYYNSERKMSAYASAEYSVPLVWGMRAGVVAGVVTGYKLAPVVPTVSLAIHTPTWAGIGATVVMVPQTKWNSGVAHLILSRSF